MQKTIIPIYENTRLLNRIQSNITKTTQELNKVKEMYATISIAEKLKDHSPAQYGIENFIKVFTKIISAKEFFNLVKKHQIEVQKCQNLLFVGQDLLERQLV